MALSTSRLLVLGATVALAGCSFASDALFPSLGGETPTEQASKPTAPPTTAAVTPAPVATAPVVAEVPPALSNNTYVPTPLTAAPSTGTFVGQKVQGFRGELRQLQDTVRQRNQTLQNLRAATAADSQQYHEAIAAISARLQVGTTPGNPVLQQKWMGAQGQLDKMNQDIASMNQLAAQAASDSGMTSYLLESIRAAYSLSGAVEEDHRQLHILEDETNQTSVLIERLMSELTQDVARQQSYIANERSNLNTLALGVKSGQMYGASLGNQSMMAAQGRSLSSLNSSASTENRRPLVVIRFDRSNVAYEQPLYAAVSRALERRPEAAFDVVAVSPATAGAPAQTALDSSTARRSAEHVMQSLSTMGLSRDRVAMSSMQSASATSPEVHLYVR